MARSYFYLHPFVEHCLLKRQRLPNLNAGIRSSENVLVKVSGEIPKYWEASRMFMDFLAEPFIHPQT